MGSRTLSFVSDNQTFSLAPFLAAPWSALASNCQHFAADRGRMVACDYYNLQAISGAATEVARYYFDSTPMETHYLVCPIVSILEWIPAMDFTILIESENTGGGLAASDTYTHSWTHPPLQGPGYEGLGPISDLDWPLSHELAGSQAYSLGWWPHAVNPALSTQGRVIMVTLSADGLNMDTVEYVSRGCAIVGYRG